MPIYEYCCQECKESFEYLVFRNQEPEGCPSCRSPKVSRIMSACGFVCKGGGGETAGSSASAGSSCGGCSASSCAGCGH